VSRWVVVLAGGVGSRFWPLSTAQRPKQLLPLVGRDPLLLEQLKRLRPLAPAKRTLILTNATLARTVARMAPKIPRANIIAEPKPAGTAAALAWAAHVIQQREGAGSVATMISVHADWAIGDDAGFRDALAKAAAAAETHRALVTVGIVPTRADPGFGYIEPGDVLGPGLRRVRRFVEKPSRERAAEMQATGYRWNSGIFAWRVDDFLTEVRRYSPEIGPLLDSKATSLKRFFDAVKKPIAIDHAVLERSSNVLVVDGDFGWDDVGTWGALQRVRRQDEQKNALSGPVFAKDATSNVVHADGQQVVLYGVNDLVVVATKGMTLVTTVDRSADLKQLVESLPAKVKRRS